MIIGYVCYLSSGLSMTVSFMLYSNVIGNIATQLKHLQDSIRREGIRRNSQLLENPQIREGTRIANKIFAKAKAFYHIHFVFWAVLVFAWVMGNTSRTSEKSTITSNIFA